MDLILCPAKHHPLIPNSKSAWNCMCTLVFTMVGVTVLAGQVMGYGILAGSLFLQLPQIIKILMAKSVVGLSKRARYAEVGSLAASGQ
jgi:hypothetical protein